MATKTIKLVKSKEKWIDKGSFVVWNRLSCCPVIKCVNDIALKLLGSMRFPRAGGRLNKKDGLTRYGDSHVKDKTS